MIPRSVFFALALLASFSAPAAVAQTTTVEVAIQAIKPDAKEITVAYKSGATEKTIKLDVSRKAEITLNGKKAELGSLGPGLKASIEYDRGLEIITKIAATGTPVANAQPELVEVSELGDARFPWFSEDGLTVYFERNMQIWTAHRNDSQSLFQDPKLVCGGMQPTLSADGVEMILIAPRHDAQGGLAFHSATRAKAGDLFRRPSELRELRGVTPENPCLSSDGLTLWFYSPPTPSIDLLSLLPGSQRDNQGVTLSDKDRFLFPYEPPAEYDLEFTFTRGDGPDANRKSGRGDVMVFLPVAGQSYVLCFRYGKSESIEVFFFPKGNQDKKILANLPPGPMIWPSKHTILLEVRRSGIRGNLDGKRLFSVEGFTGLHTGPSTQLGFFLSPGCRAFLHHVQVNGKGMFAGGVIMVCTRPDRTSPWSMPKRLPVLLAEGQWLHCPYVREDGLTLYCVDGGGRERKLMVWSRSAIDEPFANGRHIDVPGLPNLKGLSPRYIKATNEFVFSDKPGAKSPRIWIVKNFGSP